MLGDDRGFFADIHTMSEFKDNGIPSKFDQSSYTKSKKGVLRGLHYQAPPHAQGKLVRAISGRVFDVAVDLRKSSKNFGRWVSVELSEENGNMLWIPEGFAHGFIALEDDTRVLYNFTSEYSKDSGRGILWSDSRIGIDWPERTRTSAPKTAVGPFSVMQK